MTDVEVMRPREVTVAVIVTSQFHPSDDLVVPQVLSEVQVAHELKNEGEWVFPSGVNANEGYQTPAVAAE